MSQLCAAVMPGDAVRRGPSESNSVCASRGSCELSDSIAQMRRRTASSTAKPDGCGKPWALRTVVATTAKNRAVERARRTYSSHEIREDVEVNRALKRRLGQGASP